MEQSRLAGEITLGRFRAILIPLLVLPLPFWVRAHGEVLSPQFSALLILEAAHMAAALVILLLLRKRPTAGSIAWISPAIDTVMMTASMALFAAGPDAEERVRLIRTLTPALFAVFNLLSIGRSDPLRCLYTGSLGLGASVVLLAVTGGLARYDPLGSVMGLLVTGVSAVGAWRVSLGGLRLAEKSAQTERDLAREQAYQFRLFESTPEAVVQLSPTGVIIRVNPAFTRLFGYTQQESEGRNIDDLIIPETLHEEASRYSQQTARGEALLVDAVRRRKDGSAVDVSIIGAPVFVDGKQAGIFGVYRSIGERKRREKLFEALSRSALNLLLATTEEDAFRAVADELDTMGLACVLYQPVRGRPETLRITHVRADPDILGLVESLIGRPVVGLEVSCAPGTVYGRLLESQEPILAPARYRTLLDAHPAADPDREERLRRVLAHYPTISARLPGDTHPTGLVVILGSELAISDTPAMGAFAHQLAASFSKVALIRRLERNLEELGLTQARLLQSQKLEAVGRLAGGVAHDFNNLLTIITGYGEVLRDGLDVGDTRRADVDEILRAATRAAEVTRQLLAFSRRQVLRVELVDADAVVEEMRKALLRLLGEDIRLTVIRSPVLPRVRVDATQLSQALLNIALNARDAMRDGGSLEVKTALVDAGGEAIGEEVQMRPGRYVLIELSDTGSGIPVEALPHIFEPFFTTKEAGRGTGLGLAMVYGFVRQSGGYVYARNLDGGGARFSVYLPAAEPGGNEPAGVLPGVEVADARTGGNEGVLVVEDEEPVLALTCSLLERAGYRVVARSSPTEAATLPAEVLEEIHILVTDVVMPGMNGHALAETLVKRRPGLKVLYVSGYADEVFSRRGVPTGEVPHLQKPYTTAGLLRRIRDLLDAAPGL